MSIFGAILSKIFPHATAAATAPEAAAAGPGAAASPATTPLPPELSSQDVEKILTELAATRGGGGNWRVSIVDLLRMLDLDSSLAARKQLAEELNVHAGEHGSAEQNIALSKAVWQTLAKNGGKVPDSLKG
ncbi:DUF3597 domain-containing protein [Roseococcus sp. YIM B11640]|uniref:DUF3597 domain-containing protein n=1 Tax=Roseococcus sp. YIM B11640 TaxID=3133973 RepID=UPI003C7EA345